MAHPPAPARVRVTSTRLRVGDQAAGAVVRIDARTGKVTDRVKVGAIPNDGDVLDGAAWFPDRT
jgi:hypothetical protein